MDVQKEDPRISNPERIGDSQPFFACGAGEFVGLAALRKKVTVTEWITEWGCVRWRPLGGVFVALGDGGFRGLGLVSAGLRLRL